MGFSVLVSLQTMSEVHKLDPAKFLLAVLTRAALPDGDRRREEKTFGITNLLLHKVLS